jgi:Ca2+-binding EF-hand superfamily protein
MVMRSDGIPIEGKTFRKQIKTKQADIIDNIIKGNGKHHSEILKEKLRLAQRMGYEKEMSELALVARKKIQDFQNDNGQIKSLFSLYDTHRRGDITYDDFTDTFLSAGISHKDGLRLATAIDKTKSGTIEYNNILDALKDVESSYSDSKPNEDTKEKLNIIITNDDDCDDYVDNYNNNINDNKNIDGGDNIGRNMSKKMLHAISPQYISQKYKPISLSSYIDSDPDSKSIPVSPILKQSLHNWMVYNDSEKFQKQQQQQHKIRERRHVVSPTSPFSKNVAALDLGEENGSNYKSFKKYLRSSPNNFDNLYRLNLDHTGRKTHRYGRSQSAPPTNRKNSEIDKDISLSNYMNKVRSCDVYESISIGKEELKISYPNKIKHFNNPPSSPIKKEIKPSNIIENTLISQLSGRISTLRHILKKADVSKSGVINFKEFNNSIKRVGIIVKKEKLFQLFTECCNNNINNNNKSIGIIGTGLGLDIDSNGSLVNTISGSMHEKILNIDNFIERVQHTTNSPIHYDKVSRNDRTKSFNHEVLRSLKKINHIIDYSNNTKDVVDRYIGNSKNWTNPNTLRRFFNNLGANLSETEFNSLLEKINMNHHDDSININDFLNKTHDVVVKQNMEDNVKRNQMLQSHPNYNSTFKSNDVIYYFNENGM